MKQKEESKVRQLQPNVNKVVNADYSKNEELVKRKSVKDSPFEVVTQNGMSFGVMGNYRITEPQVSANAIERDLKEITWNRIIQIVMILDEIKSKLKTDENKVKPKRKNTKKKAVVKTNTN